MKNITIAVLLFLFVVVVLYAVVNQHDITIETPIGTVTSTAQKVTPPVAKTENPSVVYSNESSINPVVAKQPTEALPTTYLLKELTSLKPQEKNYIDKVYLKVDDIILTKDKEIKIGKSISVNRSVKSGAIVSLWEMDGFRQDGDDDFLGMATVQGTGGVLRFENPAVGNHSYELRFEPVR